MGGVRIKALRLLLPYITTGFIIYLLRGHFGYWFLFTLWELSMIGMAFTWLLSKINPSKRIITDIVCVLLVWATFHFANLTSLDNPFFQVSKASGYVLPLLMGMMMRKHQRIYDFLTAERRLPQYLMLFILLFAVRYLCFAHIPTSIFNKLLTLSGMLLALIGTLFVMLFFKYKSISPYLRKAFNIIGRNSLEVYIFHLLFVLQITAIGSWLLTVDFATCFTAELIYSALLSAVAIILSIGCANILKTNKTLSKLIFGI